MRIAIITDIHGNFPALQAALREIENEQADRIVCLGDIVAIGPDTNPVLELLAERTDIEYVIGNHEKAVIAAFRNEPPPRGHFREREHHEWIADRIKPEFIDFISRFPLHQTYEVNGHVLYFVHYHLKDHDFLPIMKEPDAESLDQIYEHSNYDLVCFGHHHIVHEFKGRNRLYLNPGSLGCYHKPLARYGIVEVTQEGIAYRLREVPYDNRAFLASYRTLGVPDGELILKVFHGQIE